MDVFLAVFQPHALHDAMRRDDLIPSHLKPSLRDSVSGIFATCHVSGVCVPRLVAFFYARSTDRKDSFH